MTHTTCRSYVERDHRVVVARGSSGELAGEIARPRNQRFVLGAVEVCPAEGAVRARSVIDLAAR
jgi:hypothetical protein